MKLVLDLSYLRMLHLQKEIFSTICYNRKLPVAVSILLRYSIPESRIYTFVSVKICTQNK